MHEVKTLNQGVGMFPNKQNTRIASGNLFYWFGVYLLLPVLPLFYSTLGMSSRAIGFAIGAYSVGCALSRIIAGKMADMYGCKLIVVTSLILSIFFVLGYYDTGSLLAIVVFRFLHGVSSAGYSSSAITMVTLINKEEHIKKAISQYTLASIVGIGIATSIAISLYHSVGFHLVLLLSIAAILLSLILFPKKIKIMRHLNRANKPLPIRKIISDPRIFMPTLNQFSIYLCYSCVMTFLPLLMIKHDLQKDLWIYYLFYATTVVISRFFIGKLHKFIAEKQLILWILLLFACVIIASILSQAWWTLIFIGCGVGTSVGIATPLLTSMVTSNTSPENRGVALGFFGTAIDSGMATGSILMGLVAYYFGYDIVFISAFVYTILNAILYFYWTRSKKSIQSLQTKHNLN